ncbi:histidine phosphatase family protein [Amycolatopsis sp. PS_44_ISF1]|uniref:histidine phosphatase family protein n=1 Tax=Amycolatopsis sp. PS_44_ISF1 TaxID=2974917 RepID=UPI0028E00334|nr:histidine phosphatase family protein [Amycolatopsis sp. PS_44_ISF1]MDT8914445.1 histidine phosphatase family protein [Amycolatopsis sp. PS_44_ISF1]
MRIILLRHAESLGNVDELTYTRVPDHAIPLTGAGREQAREAGPAIRELLRGRRPAVYLSPYLRTRETFALLEIEGACERVTQEPRLREQDWGNLQDPREQQVQRQRRDEFGHFFYRLPHGESGADVDDRVAAFLAELSARGGDHPETVLIVSHGLTMRLLCRRLFGWSIELFESLSNPRTCEHRVLEGEGAEWRLDRPFAQWRESPDGQTQG